MSGSEVILLYLGGFGKIYSMKISPSWTLSVVYFSKQWMVTQRHMFGNIPMKESPLPLTLIFALEKGLQFGHHAMPGFCHFIFVVLASIVCFMNVVV